MATISDSPNRMVPDRKISKGGFKLSRYYNTHCVHHSSLTPKTPKTCKHPSNALLCPASRSNYHINPSCPTREHASIYVWNANMSINCTRYNFDERKKRLAMLTFAAAGTWMSIGYDSVAAIAFPVISIFLGHFLLSNKTLRFKLILWTAALLGISITLAVIYSSHNPEWTNSQIASNLGRLQIWSFHARTAFEGLTRLLLGAGFDNTSLVCQLPVASGVLPHAHNLFLQLLTGSGILGLAGMLLFITAFIAPAVANRAKTNNKLLLISGSGLAYFLLQSSIDISAFVNTITIVFSGFLLATPQAFNPQRNKDVLPF